MALSSIESPPPHKPEPTPRGLSQGPLLLDNPIQLPPIFLDKETGESSTWDVLAQEGNLVSPGLEPHTQAHPHHTEVTPEPLLVPPSELGSNPSSDSSVRGMQRSQPEEHSDSSLLSSGYAGDEENSELNSVPGRRVVRFTRRLHAQVGNSESSELCCTTSPQELKKRRRLTSPAPRTQQTGGEK
ncbi:protein TNT [Ochotona princeps]|uniref:protein TNT n=1 Tax=Ochotona princeps TaxID=9978 RepID=UPI00271537E2|nr:protein TNT [Ochotona princeps]